MQLPDPTPCTCTSARCGGPSALPGALPNHGHAPQADAAPPPTASATRAVYHIPCMDCPMEEQLIRKRLASVPGVTGLTFNLMQRTLAVDHTLASTACIETALRSIDMRPEPIGAPKPEEAALPVRRLLLAGGCALLAELADVAHAWPLRTLSVGGADALTWLAALAALAAIALSGLATYKKGWIALKNRTLNINALMAVAVTGAVLIGQYPEAAMVMVLFNVAEVIEARALDRARKAISDLLALAPPTAEVRASDGAWQMTDIREVPPGSRVRVKPGQRVALDGRVTAGQSAVNQAPITGESLPVDKAPGDTVYAGTVNTFGSFEFEVTAAAADSTLARIIHAVEEAQATRAPTQRFVDRFAAYYTPAIFLLALLTALVPPFALGWAWMESIHTALVILVIGCPCALVIATPVSLVSGMAAATRAGLIIKGGVFLERGRRLAWIALDKTGTLTHGLPRQTDAIPTGAGNAREIAGLAASLAARSDHPVSRAIAAQAEADGVTLKPVADFTALPGRGVRGAIDGTTWRLGSRRLVDELAANTPEVDARMRALERAGKSVVALIGPDGVQGLFAVADTLRPSSVAAIRALRALGIHTMLLTGDNAHTAAAVAAEAGVDACRAELLPQDKLDAVRELGKRGPVGMVGDGINDAPALAGADIGFAMAAAGTDTAIETADVALMDDDLGKLPRFIRIARATCAIMRQNIIFALGVKAVFLALAFTGQATMWMAVFADVGASLIVVANGLRAGRAE